MFTLKHGPYIAEVDYDEGDTEFHGRVVNTRDIIHFAASSLEGLQSEFAASVDDYVEFCRAEGVSPEKPYSGNIPLRITPKLHRELDRRAHLANMSLNAFVTQTLEAGVLGEGVLVTGGGRISSVKQKVGKTLAPPRKESTPRRRRRSAAKSSQATA